MFISSFSENGLEVIPKTFSIHEMFHVSEGRWFAPVSHEFEACRCIPQLFALLFSAHWSRLGTLIFACYILHQTSPKYARWQQPVLLVDLSPSHAPGPGKYSCHLFFLITHEYVPPPMNFWTFDVRPTILYSISDSFEHFFSLSFLHPSLPFSWPCNVCPHLFWLIWHVFSLTPDIEMITMDK